MMSGVLGTVAEALAGWFVVSAICALGLGALIGSTRGFERRQMAVVLASRSRTIRF